MDPLDLAHWRLHVQGVTGAPFAAPDAAVSWLTAVQSQDYHPAKWAVGQRTRGATDAALDHAFDEGAILRTHVLRPTWHFVAPGDIRWMLALTAPRVNVQMGSYFRKHGIDDVTVGRCQDLLIKALSGGGQLTRKQIIERFAAAGLPAGNFEVGLALMRLELGGVVCSGSLDGRQHTYALLEERAPNAKSLDHDEALATLTRRYFTSHGPASVKDFRWWSSLTVADIKRGLEMVHHDLDEVIVDGIAYLFGEPAPTSPRSSTPSAHLLQGYDEYIVGYQDTRYLLDLSGQARNGTADRSVPTGVAIIDTQVAGHWRRTITSRTVVFEILLHERPDARQLAALEAAVTRQAAFLERDAELSTALL